MKKKLTQVLLAALLVLTLGIAGCGQKADVPVKGKVLKVGAETTFPPFEFQDENTKEYAGFDIDLMKAIGKQLGYEVQIQSMGFDGLIPALQSGNIDAIASAMSITPERAQKVSFSKPYYTSGLTIVVKKDNNIIKSFKDLEGKKIAVQIGTTSATEMKKINGTSVREYNSTSDAYMELKTGGVDAVVNDLPVNQDYLKKGGDKDAKLVGEISNAEQYGIAVAQKNTELTGKINNALEELKKNGEYEKLYVKWFGKKPTDK